MKNTNLNSTPTKHARVTMISLGGSGKSAVAAKLLNRKPSGPSSEPEIIDPGSLDKESCPPVTVPISHLPGTQDSSTENSQQS